MTASEKFVEVLHKCFDDIEEWMRSKSFNFNVRLCDINLSRSITRACGIGNNSAAVDHNGNIALCQMVFNDKVGNVKTEGLIDAISSQRVMPELRSKNINDYDGCKCCIWKKVCAGGCPVFTFKQTSILNRPSPYCSTFKQLIPRLIKLEGIKLQRKIESG